MQSIGASESKILSSSPYYDFLCCVGACTGISPDVLHVSSGVCYQGSDIVRVTSTVLSDIALVWERVSKSGMGAVGIGLYTDFYLVSSTPYLYHRVYGTVTHVLLVELPLGRSIDSIRSEAIVGARSVRQQGTVTFYDPLLFDYWSKYRGISVIGNLMAIEHILPVDVAESFHRLQRGLVPHRRYNTPLIRREDITILNRSKYKWMALQLLNGSRAYFGAVPVSESEIIIDERGILRVPISSLVEENAFSSLWSQVEATWERIENVRVVEEEKGDRSLSVDNENVVSIDNIHLEVILAD
jgi:hypothetical protein